jgi:N-acetylneuraminic acid mutarotase
MNSSVLTYNAATNTWHRKTINDSDVGSLILRARPNGVARLGNVLYETGGLNLRNGFGDNDANSLWPGTDAYKTSTNSLVPAAAFPRLSADGVTGVINGKIYVLIGSAAASPSPCETFGCPLATVRQLYRYDPVTSAWVTRKAPPHFHRSGVGGVINGKFYVVGGFDSKGNASGNLDVYNPATDSWTTLALLPKRLTGLKGTVLQNKLYVVSPTATYAYNPATNTWAQKALGPAGSAARVEGGAAATVTLNGRQRMIVAGGKRSSAGVLPTTAIYVP